MMKKIEALKEKGKAAGDWVENNFGKACFIGLTAFEVAIWASVKHSNDKVNSAYLENDRRKKKEDSKAYREFLEDVLEKSFKEKEIGIPNDEMKLGKF